MDQEVGACENPVELFCGRVEHILDLQNFWIQIGTRKGFSEFSDLEDSFQEFCDEIGTFPPGLRLSIDEGSFILVKSCHTKGKYKRAQVARSDMKETIDVFYLDYGNTEVVSANRVCVALPVNFFASNLELMKCGLAGLRPIAKTWTTRGIKCFEKLTKELILQVVIVSFKPLEMLNEISLYSQEGDHKSITHILLEEEIGMPTDLLVSVPQFVRDVTHVLPSSYYEWYENIGAEERDEIEANDTVKTFSQKSSNIEKTFTKESRNTKKIFLQEPSKEASEIPQNCKETLSLNSDKGGLSPDTVSPPVVVPGFDMSEIFKTALASPGSLEKMMDSERQKETKIELQRDIQNVQEDTPLTEDTWEMTDLTIGQTNSHMNDVTIGSKIALIKEFTESPEKAFKSEVVVPAKKNAVNKTTATEEQKKLHPLTPIKKIHGDQLQNLTNVKGFSVQSAQTYSSACNYSTKSSDKDYREELDETEATLIKQMNEIELYEISKQLQQILLQSECSDFAAVREKFYRMVPADEEHQPAGLLSVLDVLVEQGVKKPDSQDLILSVLDSYSECFNFGSCLQQVLKDSEKRFIRNLSGRTGYHTEFAHILGQMLIHSRHWIRSAADVTQNFILSICEKWVIFNKNILQKSNQVKKLMDLYCECLEEFWNIAGITVNEVSPTKYLSIQTEMRDKILSDNLDRNLRLRYLVLLISIQQPGVKIDITKPTTRETFMQTDIQTCCSVQVQTDNEQAPQLIPYIIPNLKTNRVSDQWKDNMSTGGNVTSPDSQLNNLSHYCTRASCVSDGQGKSDSKQNNRDKHLKTLALRQLDSAAKICTDEEFPAALQKHQRETESRTTDYKMRKTTNDGENRETKLSNVDNLACENRTKSGHTDWLDTHSTLLDNQVNMPMSNFPKHNKYDGVKSYDLKHSVSRSVDGMQNPVASSESNSAFRKRNSSVSKNNSKSYFKEAFHSSSVAKLDLAAVSRSYEGSAPPPLHSGRNTDKSESIKSVDSVAKKYLPAKLQNKSSKHSTQKKSRRSSENRKVSVTDWWEADDLNQCVNKAQEKKNIRASESLLSIVKDVLCVDKTSEVDKFDDNRVERLLTDTCDQTQNEEMKCFKNLEKDEEPWYTKSVDNMLHNVIPEYFEDLELDDSPDNDDDFQDISFVDDLLNRGDRYVTSCSPQKKSEQISSWVPSKRQCTLCHSHQHVAYSCPDRKQSFN